MAKAGTAAAEESAEFRAGVDLVANTVSRETKDFAFTLRNQQTVIEGSLLTGFRARHSIPRTGAFIISADTMFQANISHPIHSASTAAYVISNISTNIPVNPDPSISGTNIPIYRIAALIDGGMTIAQVMEDFPSLTQNQILTAYEFASENPPGPDVVYPKTSLKRLLRSSGFAQLKNSLRAGKARS